MDKKDMLAKLISLDNDELKAQDLYEQAELNYGNAQSAVEKYCSTIIGEFEFGFYKSGKFTIEVNDGAFGRKFIISETPEYIDI